MRAGTGGYRSVAFSQASKQTLRSIAEQLKPHEDRIVQRWVEMQLRSYLPPRLTPDEIRALYDTLLRRMIELLGQERPEVFIGELYEAGAKLAESDFPYEGLIMSLHFLEESYMPYLIEDDQRLTRQRFVWMDEFMHVALGALATSYFRAFRDSLLGQAEVGRIVQEGLLASIPMRVGRLDVGSTYLSATSQALVGGDVLDVFPIGDGASAFVVGDVCGHGVAAATDGAMLRHLFRGFLRTEGSLTAAVARINDVLAVELAGRGFISGLFGTCDRDGRLLIVNAGHPKPIVCTGDTCVEADCGGMLLGILEGQEYDADELVLEPGDSLLAYTDGMIEARDENGFFGEERVERTFAELRDMPPQMAVDALRTELLAFAGGQLEDDVAMLVLRRRHEG